MGITFKTGDIVKDRYVIEKQLGEGGFGIVYKALDRNMGRDVALKFIKIPYYAKENQGFQILLDTTHRNVVKVFNVERYNDEHIFFEYEFIQGKTLNEYIYNTSLSLSEINEIIRYLLDGMQEISKIAWHRDIKLNNIMISNNDASTLKILDLGIAKLKDAESSFSFCGTPGYMPPEAEDNKCDETYDVFSVGVVYYRLLANTLPYGSLETYKEVNFEGLEEVANKKLLESTLPIPRIVKEFVLKAIRLKNDERFLSIDDMARKFRMLLEKLKNHNDAINNSDTKIREFYDFFEKELTNNKFQIASCTRIDNGLKIEIVQNFTVCILNLYKGKKRYTIVKLPSKDSESNKIQNVCVEIANRILKSLNIVEVRKEITMVEGGDFSLIPEINAFIAQKLHLLEAEGIIFNKTQDLAYGTKFILHFKSIDIPIIIYFSKKRGISYINELKGHEEIKKFVDTLFRDQYENVEDNFKIPFENWIGSDESGKGDLFGPLVGAAFFIEKKIITGLLDLGIKDSKQLSDTKIEVVAKILHENYGNRISICELSPEKYNELYLKFRSQGGNLNTLLAWCHARAIQDLAEIYKVEGAVADQFGDESYIIEQFNKNGKMKDAKQLKLIQRPKAEENLAVAAASILARDRFLKRIREYSHKYKIEIPKGAGNEANSAAVHIKDKFGGEELKKIIKMHFKNVKNIL